MRIIYCLSILALLLFVSCKGTVNKEDSGPKAAAGKTGTVKIINEKDLQEIISRRNGKVLFLNVWATWCAPCVEEFPAIVKLNSSYKNKNVEVIGLSVDMASDIDTKVKPFLIKQGADFRVVAADEKRSGQIIEALNPNWSGGVPVTFIFDENGKQQKYLEGAQTYQQMASAVDSVVNSL